MASLQDQLLKAGLTTKQKSRQANSDMRKKNKHDHLFALTADFKFRDEKALLKLYVENLEGMLKKYPLQWFNYFDFWNAFKN